MIRLSRLVAPVPPLDIGTVSLNVEPAAVTVIFPVPSKLTPLIVLAVSNAVAVAAFPVVLPELPLALPVTLPVMGPAKPVAVSIPVLAL